jgi:hypothetical protein
VGTDSLFEDRVAPGTHPDFGRESSLTDANVKEDQYQAAKRSINSRIHYWSPLIN